MNRLYNIHEKLIKKIPNCNQKNYAKPSNLTTQKIFPLKKTQIKKTLTMKDQQKLLTKPIVEIPYPIKIGTSFTMLLSKHSFIKSIMYIYSNED